MNKTAVKEGEGFPIAAPPQETVYEATTSASEKLQSLVHKLNANGADTGWMFAIVSGGGKSDDDGLVRMKAHGYTQCTKAEVTALGTYLGFELPLQTYEVLMRKPYGQYKADKQRGQDTRNSRRPTASTTTKIGDAEGGVSALESTVSPSVIRVQSPQD